MLFCCYFEWQGIVKETEDSNFEREGETYKDIVCLLSAASPKFKDRITSKEFALHQEKKAEQVLSYNDDDEDEDDYGDRPLERSSNGKEDNKEEKANKQVIEDGMRMKQDGRNLI